MYQANMPQIACMQLEFPQDAHMQRGHEQHGLRNVFYATL